MGLAQTAYGFAIGKRARFVLSIIKQKTRFNKTLKEKAIQKN